MKNWAYYNENNPQAAAWLRELIRDGHIAPGTVDERSISDVKPADLEPFTQCHFFAGIGGWSYALRIAGWPDEKKVWTGSCPCQPFSIAGKGKVDKDERHLWPAFRELVSVCRPSICFGEQVCSKDGRIWFAGVRSDLEAMGYGVGAVDSCAAGVSAPHIRQRIFWVSHSRCQRDEPDRIVGCSSSASGEAQSAAQKRERGRVAVSDSRETFGMGIANGSGRHQGRTSGASARHGDTAESASGGMGQPVLPRLEGHAGNGNGGDQSRRFASEANRSVTKASHAGFWDQFDICHFTDGKQRRIKPVFFIDADGISSIMGHRWIGCVSQLETALRYYAEITTSNTQEILRAMQKEALSKALRSREHAGGHDTIPFPEILLIALCQLAWRLGKESDSPAPHLSETQEVAMRILWESRTSSRSPHQLQLDRSPNRESENSFRFVPQEGSHASKKALHLLHSTFSETRDVPEAFSAVEEIWRSYADQNTSTRTGVSLDIGASILVATIGYPLARSVPGMAALLKGAGNAIVPPLAAEFILAAVEAINGEAEI